MFSLSITLHWHHNGRDCISNHQPHQPFIQAHIKENIKVPSLVFVRGIHQWPVNSPCKWPVKRKMFPFNDVIMNSEHWDGTGYWNLSRWITRIPLFGKRSLKINVFFKIYFSIWQLMWLQSLQWHHLSVMASEITGIMTLVSAACSDYQQRKHRSSIYSIYCLSWFTSHYVYCGCILLWCINVVILNLNVKMTSKIESVSTPWHHHDFGLMMDE